MKPGIYVAEREFFPRGTGVVEVETGTALFIGHSAFARAEGRNVTGKAVPVGSMADFEAWFGGRIHRRYHLGQGDSAPGERDHGPAMPGSAWRLREAATPVYRLRDSVALFFANGGRRCIIISCGDYATPPSAEVLIGALETASHQIGPSIVLIPDMAALDREGHARVAAAMLDHCGKLRDRVAILDLWGADRLAPGADFGPLVSAFRASFDRSALDTLSFGTAYFPYLETSLFASDAVDMRWFDLSERHHPALLAALRAAAPDPARVEPLLDAIGQTVDDDVQPEPGRYGHRQLARALGVGIPGFEDLRAAIAAAESRLPPSGAMAGCWVRMDELLGYWKPAANLSIAMAKAPSVMVDDAAQQELTGPLDGRAINPVRVLRGRGLVVWGARTLDGNSPDWRYIWARRAAICIEQSIGFLLDSHVFFANNEETWRSLRGEVTSFLTNLWKRGCLVGETAEDAFSVDVGLGSTMTAQTILDGDLILSVRLALQRPAEFVELSFTQRMQGA